MSSALYVTVAEAASFNWEILRQAYLNLDDRFTEM